MTTVYDWITVAVFAGLVVLFLHRSDQAVPPPEDALWHYLVAAAGCALVNWLGNEGRHVAAAAAFLCLGGFIAVVLKPFFRRG